MFQMLLLTQGPAREAIRLLQIPPSDNHLKGGEEEEDYGIEEEEGDEERGV